METLDYFVLFMVLIAFLGWLFQDEFGAQPPDVN